MASCRLRRSDLLLPSARSDSACGVQILGRPCDLAFHLLSTARHRLPGWHPPLRFPRRDEVVAEVFDGLREVTHHTGATNVVSGSTAPTRTARLHHAATTQISLRFGSARVVRAFPTRKPGFRSSWSHVSRDSRVELGKCRYGRVGACVYARTDLLDLVQVGAKAVTRAGGWMDSAW
jgi:hypothetical protein